MNYHITFKILHLLLRRCKPLCTKKKTSRQIPKIVHEFPKHSLRYKLIFTLNNTSTTIIEKTSSQSLKKL